MTFREVWQREIDADTPFGRRAEKALKKIGPAKEKAIQVQSKVNTKITWWRWILNRMFRKKRHSCCSGNKRS